MRDGFAAGIGRLTPGHIVSDRDGNLTDTRSGEAVAPPDAPAEKAAGKPQFSKEDLALVNSDDADIDAEQAVRAKEMKRLGFTEEEIERHAGSPSAQAPAVTLASIERELAEIADTRRADSRAYWKDEALQKRELALIEQREALKAGKPEAAAKSEPTANDKAEDEDDDEEPGDGSAKGDGAVAAADARLAEIGAEAKGVEARLAELRALRKTDLKKYMSAEVQDEELRLTGEVATLKELRVRHENLKGFVVGALDAALDAAGLEAGFDEFFGASSEESQEAVREALATPVDTFVVKSALEAQVASFASISDEAAELVRTWGAKAAQRIGRMNARVDAIAVGLSDADFERASAWIDALTPDSASKLSARWPREDTMSGLIGVCGETAVHLMTDGASVDAATGALVACSAKQLVGSDTAIATTGYWPPCAAFAGLVNRRCASFDSAVAAAADLWIQARQDVPNDIAFGVLLAGFSRQRQRLEMYSLESHAEPDLADLAAFAVGPTDEAAAVTRPFVAKFCRHPEAFDPIRDGIALMQDLRRYRRQFSGAGSHPAVGRFVQLTTVTRTGVTTRIVHRWPGDVVGRPIALEKEAA